MTEDISDYEIDLAIRLHEGDSLPGFPSPDTFEYLILPYLKRIQSPVMECLGECISSAFSLSLSSSSTRRIGCTYTAYSRSFMKSRPRAGGLRSLLPSVVVFSRELVEESFLFLSFFLIFFHSDPEKKVALIQPFFFVSFSIAWKASYFPTAFSKHVFPKIFTPPLIRTLLSVFSVSFFLWVSLASLVDVRTTDLRRVVLPTRLFRRRPPGRCNLQAPSFSIDLHRHVSLSLSLSVRTHSSCWLHTSFSHLPVYLHTHE